MDFAKTVSYIRDLYNSPEGFVNLHAPVFAGKEKEYLARCIDSTFVSYVGEFVNRFEELTSAFTGAKYCIAVVNGTTALQIALVVSGVKNGDEVITSPLTFAATANAIVHAGGTPVFVDCEENTLGLNPDELETFLTNNAEIRDKDCYNLKTGKKISACVPVHVFGHPCNILTISNICQRWNIPLIEDAAESLGSFVDGRHTGSFGLAGIISYNGNKTITTGGGGMILTNNQEFAERAKYITTTAKRPHPYEFFHTEPGYNFRMPNVNAAIGVAQMEQIEKFLQSKRQTAIQYQAFFEGEKRAFFNEKSGFRTNFWLNCIFLNDRKERDAFLQFTNSASVMTRPAWTLMNKLPMYQTNKKFPVAEKIENTLVSIPSSVRL